MARATLHLTALLCCVLHCTARPPALHHTPCPPTARTRAHGGGDGSLDGPPCPRPLQFPAPGSPPLRGAAAPRPRARADRIPLRFPPAARHTALTFPEVQKTGESTGNRTPGGHSILFNGGSPSTRGSPSRGGSHHDRKPHHNHGSSHNHGPRHNGAPHHNRVPHRQNKKPQHKHPIYIHSKHPLNDDAEVGFDIAESSETSSE